MATTTSSAALVPVTPVLTNIERLALAGFLAGYSGLTRQAYELDLRQYASWCHQHQVHTLRHAFITAAKVSGVASYEAFGVSDERALPAVQRTALAELGAALAHRPRLTWAVIIGLHQPPTMMQPVRRRLMPA